MGRRGIRVIGYCWVLGSILLGVLGVFMRDVKGVRGIRRVSYSGMLHPSRKLDM